MVQKVMLKKTVCIIETNNCHEEVILNQINFLKSDNIEVRLFLNEKIKGKNVLNKEPNLSVSYYSFSTKISSFISSLRIIISILFHRYYNIVYNSFNNKRCQLIYNFLKNKNNVFIIHNADEYYKNNKYKSTKTFVLSEHVFNSVKRKYNINNISYFYPLIINNVKKSSIYFDPSQKYICIPGKVEFTRRDYLGLIEYLSHNEIKNTKFVILGNLNKEDGPKVEQLISKNHLEDQFITFDNFVPYDLFFEYLANCNYIMPLIHPNVKNFEAYHSTKISAAFSMAFSFKKPLLIYKTLNKLAEFNDYSISYTLNNLKERIKNISENDIYKISSNYEEQNKFDNSIQCTLYKQLIFDN